MQDIFYTDKAQKVQVVGKTNEGVPIVQHLYETEDYEGETIELPGDLASYSGKLFKEPPALDQTPFVQQLNATKRLLTDEVNNLSKQKADLEKDLYELNKNIASLSPTYERAMKYRNGEFTHAVIHEYSDINIYPIDDKRITETEYSYRGIKLMCLYGTPHGGEEVWMNQYRDGSGSSSHKIELFSSYEDALAYVTEYVAKEFATRNTEGKNEWVYEELIRTAKKYSLPIPSAALEFYKNIKVQQAKKTVEQSQSQLDSAIKALREYESMNPTPQSGTTKGDE